MLPATFSASFWSASVSIQSSRGTHSAVYPFAAWPRVVTVARRSMAISSPSCGIPSMAVAGWQLGALSNHWCFSWHCSQSLVFLSYLLKRCSGLARLFLPFFMSFLLQSPIFLLLCHSLSLSLSLSIARCSGIYVCQVPHTSPSHDLVLHTANHKWKWQNMKKRKKERKNPIIYILLDICLLVFISVNFIYFFFYNLNRYCKYTGI